MSLDKVASIMSLRARNDVVVYQGVKQVDHLLHNNLHCPTLNSN